MPITIGDTNGSTKHVSNLPFLPAPLLDVLYTLYQPSLIPRSSSMLSSSSSSRYDRFCAPSQFCCHNKLLERFQVSIAIEDIKRTEILNLQFTDLFLIISSLHKYIIAYSEEKSFLFPRLSLSLYFCASTYRSFFYHVRYFPYNTKQLKRLIRKEFSNLHLLLEYSS